MNSQLHPFRFTGLGEMILLLGARAMFPRSFHTSVVRFQPHKDVSKLNEYQAPFDEGQKHDILEKINTFTEKELGQYTTKRFSKQISDYKVNFGQFLSIEKLLDLPNVEPKNLLKLCNKLIIYNSDQSLPEKFVPKMRAHRTSNRQFTGIYPTPDLKLWNSFENPRLVGISVNLQGITYAEIDSFRQHCGWAALPGVSNPNSQISFQHRNLFDYALGIVDEIPEADYYLFEEPRTILPKDPYMKHKINLMKLRSTLMTIMMRRVQADTDTIHTIKPAVLDDLFDLKVGSERISIKNALDRIICGTDREDSQFIIDISQESWNYYNKCNNKGKEYLASSLLKALAFNHLCRAISLDSNN